MILALLIIFTASVSLGFVAICFNGGQKQSSGKSLGLRLQKFLSTQFQSEITTKQKVFDYIFGVILPAICFFFDPLIFRSFGGHGGAIAGEYKPFVYLLSFISIIALLGFNLLGEKLKWLNGFFAGLFAIASFGAFAIGLCMLPLSLIGLIFLIGALGFTPLFTGFVFWRNAVRAYKVSTEFLGKNFAVRAMILTVLFGLVVPMIINVKIQRGLETMQNGNAAEIRRTANRLKFVAPLVDFGKLHLKTDSQYNFLESEENQALKESYKMLTGKELIVFTSAFD